jgi:hypothetical protein
MLGIRWDVSAMSLTGNLADATTWSGICRCRQLFGYARNPRLTDTLLARADERIE